MKPATLLAGLIIAPLAAHLPAATITSSAVMFGDVLLDRSAMSASQSSTSSGGLPARAIDGNYNQNWGGGSITHTASQAGAWWQADLGSIQNVTGVHLFNRGDCCAERLTNFIVSTSNDPAFGSVLSSTTFPGQAASMEKILLPPSDARYVRVQLVGTNVLSLAEVDVFSAGPVGSRSPVVGDLASLYGVASQSTTRVGSGANVAAAALDGRLFGDFVREATTTHTNGDVNPWFEVDLSNAPDKSLIKEITLYNRWECCQDRLSNFRLSIWDDGTEVWGENFFTTGGNAGLVFSVADDAGWLGRGDTVRLQLLGGTSRILSLSEIQIWGMTPEPSRAVLLMLPMGTLALRRRR
jgi:hypothetical protein